MFGFLAPLALKHPKVFSLLKRFVPFLLGAILMVLAVWWFNNWKDDLKRDSFNAGRSQAEAEYTAAINASNARELETQRQINDLIGTINILAEQREEKLNVVYQPILKRIEQNVATDPRYTDCTVSNGVLFDLNAGRAAVDQSIAASTPVLPR
jgi:hypothetical protein